MNHHPISLAGETLHALPSGALHWPAEALLVVADLHLCRSERLARRGGGLLPPYETRETLSRLAEDVRATSPATVLCLGDSFDDLAAADALDPGDAATLAGLQAGRRWLWVEGNHDPGPLGLAGTHLAEHALGPLAFRHIATPGGDPGEISGHYHPKARLRGGARPAFLADATRLILPAYGCYTGGLDCTATAFAPLFPNGATAYLTGRRVIPVPVAARAA